MPQIRCPNCGITINMETRKEMDMDLILGTLRNGPKTFTQLLQATRLPRKTFYLRLKELVDSGTIVKDRGYRLNESLRTKNKTRRGYELKSKISRFIKENPDGNRDALIIVGLLVFLIASPMLFASPLVYAHRVHDFGLRPKGINELFTVAITVDDAVDLYAWQGEITFNPNVLVVSDVAAGKFLSPNALVINATSGFYLADEPQSANYSILLFADDASSGTLLLGGSLLGHVSGESGSGTLATVTFRVVKDIQGSIDAYLEGGIMLLTPGVTDAEGVLAIET